MSIMPPDTLIGSPICLYSCELLPTVGYPLTDCATVIVYEKEARADHFIRLLSQDVPLHLLDTGMPTDIMQNADSLTRLPAAPGVG